MYLIEWHITRLRGYIIYVLWCLACESITHVVAYIVSSVPMLRLYAACTPRFCQQYTCEHVCVCVTRPSLSIEDVCNLYACIYHSCI